MRPNEIPIKFGGLSVEAEDISSEDIAEAISIKAGKRKTVEIQCPNVSGLLSKFQCFLGNVL